MALPGLPTNVSFNDSLNTPTPMKTLLMNKGDGGGEGRGGKKNERSAKPCSPYRNFFKPNPSQEFQIESPLQLYTLPPQQGGALFDLP